MQSQLLTDFYNAYNEWVEAGAPGPDLVFHRNVGLCWALVRWVRSDASLLERLSVEMEEQFDAANLATRYPFGRDEFKQDGDQGTMHLDPKRIAWVKAHLV